MASRLQRPSRLPTALADRLEQRASATAVVAEHLAKLRAEALPREAGAWPRIEEIARDAVELIFTHGESKLEYVFLTALLLELAELVPFDFVFTGPIQDVDVERRRARDLIALRAKVEAEHEREIDAFDQEAQDWWVAENGGDLDALTEHIRDLEDFDRYLESQVCDGALAAADARALAGDVIRLSPYGGRTWYVSLQSGPRDVLVDGISVRCDLLVWSPASDAFNLVVECDGFEWHGGGPNPHYPERLPVTRAAWSERYRQAQRAFARDRARDRALLRRGFQVIRYSGAEVRRDPLGSAGDCIDHILDVRDRAELYDLGRTARDQRASRRPADAEASDHVAPGADWPDVG